MEKFCLKWNEYETNISSTFQDLRNDMDFSDVTLAAEGDLQVEAHRIVLAASSPFFSSLLRKNKKEDRHTLIYLKGVKAKDLVSVVDFMYYGEVNVYQEDLKEFLCVAEELQLRGLRQDDSEEKKSSLKPQNGAKNVKIEQRDNEDEVVDHILVGQDDCSDMLEDDEITELDDSFSEAGSRQSVEEADDIERMINSMMVRVGMDWTCSVCGKKAGKYKNNLRKHVEIVHVDQRGKPCKFCGKIFKSRPNLYAHMRRCQHNDQQSTRTGPPAYLSFIQQEKNNRDESDALLAVQSMEVSEAKVDMDFEAKVESLMTRLDGDWICGVCGKNAGKLKSNLRKHVEAKHIDGQVFPCDLCGRTFGSQNALQCHPCSNLASSPPFVVSVKPEITGLGFICHICNKEFKTNQSLKVHTQAIHEGVKYNCEFCSHSATTKSNLKVHTQKKHSMNHIYI